MWHAIPFPGSEGSLEMLPTYLVTWNYEYREFDPISYPRTRSRGQGVFGSIDHDNVSSESGACN